MTVVLQGRNWTARMEVSRYGLRAGAGIDDTGAWSIGVGVRDPSGVAIRPPFPAMCLLCTFPVSGGRMLVARFALPGFWWDIAADPVWLRGHGPQGGIYG